MGNAGESRVFNAVKSQPENAGVDGDDYGNVVRGPISRRVDRAFSVGKTSGAGDDWTKRETWREIVANLNIRLHGGIVIAESETDGVIARFQIETKGRSVSVGIGHRMRASQSRIYGVIAVVVTGAREITERHPITSDGIRLKPKHVGLVWPIGNKVGGGAEVQPVSGDRRR